MASIERSRTEQVCYFEASLMNIEICEIFPVFQYFMAIFAARRIEHNEPNLVVLDKVLVFFSNQIFKDLLVEYYKWIW